METADPEWIAGISDHVVKTLVTAYVHQGHDRNIRRDDALIATALALLGHGPAGEYPEVIRELASADLDLVVITVRKVLIQLQIVRDSDAHP